MLKDMELYNKMEELRKHTPTELLKMINDTKRHHETLKQEIIDLTYEVEVIEEKINVKLDLLTTEETIYVQLVEEINNRENAV